MSVMPDCITAYQLATNKPWVGYPNPHSPQWESEVLDGLERQKISVFFDFCKDDHVHVYLGGRQPGVEWNSGHRVEALCAAILERNEWAKREGS